MKSIFTILLFISLQSFGQHYFIIPTMTNPENKARLVSQKFYRLSRPNMTDTTKYLFGYIKHPVNDSVAIVIDSAFNLPKGAINATRITEWIAETYPTITTTQRNTLTNYINSNNILRISRLILTARIKLWTKTQMTARGWFDFPPI